MPFNLPQRRITPRSINPVKRNIPVDQIIAIQGQNPLATGVEAAGNLIGQALTRKAQLRQEGQQLAALERLSGQQSGAFQGLPSSVATPIATKMMENRAENYTPQQLQAIYSGDPAAISAAFQNGVPKEAASLASTALNRDENRRLREQQIDALAQEREKSRHEKRSKEKTDIVSKFTADPGVRKIQSSLDSASNVRELALSGNPIAASAIPTYMARASGEVGNLSEADKRPFGGSQAILRRLEASLTQMANGQITPENQKFIIDLADTMESSAIGNLDRRAKDVSSVYGRGSDFLKSDEIYNTLRPISTPKPKALPQPGFTVEEEAEYQAWKASQTGVRK